MIWLIAIQLWCMAVAVLSSFPSTYNVWRKSANKRMRRDKYHLIDWLLIASFIAGWLIIGYAAIYGSLWFLPNYIGDGSIRHILSITMGFVFSVNLMWITQERAENKRDVELKSWMQEKKEDDARKGRLPRSKPSD